MKKMYLKRFLCITALLIPLLFFSQQPGLVNVYGSVKEKSTRKGIENVEVRVIGGGYVKTDSKGNFSIKARVGDELVISHEDFQHVFHRVNYGGQRVDVEVEDNPADVRDRKKKKTQSDFNYQLYVKLAKKMLQKDAAKSIDAITKALETIRDDDPLAEEKKAALFDILGDIYSYWKQPDLAVDNYKISLGHKFDKDVKIKLGNSQLRDKDFQGGVTTFTQLQKSRLSSKDRLKVHEGLGDGYKGLGDYIKANSNYQKALSYSNKKGDDRIRLNSKIAEVLDQQGNSSAAERYLDNSVQMATQTNRKAAARQRTKAADFYNKNNSYQKEIELRQQAIEDIEQIPIPVSDSIANEGEVEDKALTTQVQNYKIANAFAAQEEYDEAINYLKESKKEAESKNDLVVQKDATLKLGEVYREKGELKKASEAFKEYEVIVDKLYFQKDQEISQAARFSKELAQRANRIATLEKDRELNEARYQLAFASQEIANQRSLQQQIIIYALIGLLVFLLLGAYLMYRNIRQQRYANNLLALKSLRSQMNPHFIFNALNSVNTFIATSDERTANKYLTDFSLLMRAVLENSEEDFIPLEKEIELLELYVHLEHFRFQDKFEYEIIVDPEINIKEFVIPPMLLQPYVENAVWHGLRYKEDKGLLSIHFKNEGRDVIQIVISDNGIGRKRSKELKTSNQKLQKSKGMSNIKKRITILNQMYKDKVDVFISDLNDKEEGTQVKLLLKKDK